MSGVDLEREETAALRRLARVWDDLLPIPFLSRRFGLDAVLGLVPGIGDVVSALVAAWALVVAAQLGAPASILGRMVYNIALDAIVGSIPLAGDIFDFGWRAQSRNVSLLERWLVAPTTTRRRSMLLLAITGATVVAILVATLWLGLTLVAMLLPGI